MAYKSFRLTGGLNLKADATAIQDGQLTEAQSCAYDTVGAVSSARGRLVLNSGVPLAGDGTNVDIRGYFDAFTSAGLPVRYTKSGTSVYQWTEGSTPVLVGSNGSFPGTGILSGFGYNSYVYLCDGTTMARIDPAVPGTLQTWGLVSPGYFELGASPLSSVNSTTITLTTPTAHGLVTGMTVELFGLLSVNGIPATGSSAAVEINGQHIITVKDATTFTFTSASAGTTAGPVTGGGSAGMMKQGPTVTSPTGGKLLAGVYKWAYTFYNGFAESNFSALVKADVDPILNDKGEFTNILIGPVGTTERRIYRTDINGTQIYYVGTISDNTTTTYSDLGYLPPNASSTALPGDAISDTERSRPSNAELRDMYPAVQGKGARYRLYGSLSSTSSEVIQTNLGLLADWTDHDPPPATIEQVLIVNDQAVAISGNTVQFSKVGNPEHWPLDNRILPGRNTGETLKCVRQFDRDLVIYTDSGLYRLTQLGLSFEDSRFEAIDTPVGTTSKRGVAVLDGQNGHVFVANTGLYLFDGQRVQEASLAIDVLFNDPTASNAFDMAYNDTVIVEALRDKVFVSYGVSADNDNLLIMDYESLSDPKATIVPWRFTTLFRERAGNQLIAGDTSGYVYQLDYGYTDYKRGEGGAAGLPESYSATNWACTTKDYQLADGAAFILDELVLDAKLLSTSATTVVATTRGRGVSHSATFTITGEDIRRRYKLKCPQYLRGEAVSVRLTSGSTERRDLYAVGFTYTSFQEEP